MENNIVFKVFDSKKDLAEQRALFKDCFPETNGQAIQGIDHYQWKYHTFPSTVKDKSWEYVGYIGDEMVGYYAAIPYQYKIGTRTTPIGMVCDVMTSSRHRGKGIFTRMGRYATGRLAEHVPFTTGYPIRKAVIPGHLKVGWRIAFEMPLYMKFIKTNALLSSKKIGWLAYFINPVLSVYNAIASQKIKSAYFCDVFSDISNIEGYDEFVGEWMNEVPNALDKRLPFAKWRYSAPEREYQFVVARDMNGKMVGFVAYRAIEREGVPSLCIMDYMVLQQFDDCHGTIQKALLSEAKKGKIEAIMTMMSKTSAHKYKLMKNGFLKSPFTFNLIIKKLRDDYTDEELFDENNWHLMWVDSDDL